MIDKGRHQEERELKQTNFEVSTGRGSKEERHMLYMVESCRSLGTVQSGTRAQETDFRHATLERRRAPFEGSCSLIITKFVTRQPLIT